MIEKEVAEQMVLDMRSVCELVIDRPDDLFVDYVSGERTLVIRVKPHKSDLGKLIGQKGSMATSLRKILMAVSAKRRIRAVLEIEE